MARMLNSTDEQTENFRKVENYKKKSNGQARNENYIIRT